MLDKVCKTIVKRGGNKQEAWLTGNSLRWQEKGCILRPNQFSTGCYGTDFNAPVREFISIQ